MYGYFHQVTPQRLAELLDEPALVQEELYPDEGSAERCDIEKTWNAIEFTLTLLAQQGHFPEDSVYFKDPVRIGPPLVYDPAEYWTPEEVGQLAEQFSQITDELFRDAYAPALMAEYHVYPDVWDREDEAEENFQWIRGYFREMTAYFQQAAAAGNAMLQYLG